MANIQIFDLNNWDNQILNGTSYISGWPWNNTQHRWKTKSVRLAGLTGKYIRTENSIGLTANAFFIFYHNMTSLGTIGIRGSNDNWITNPLIGFMTRTNKLWVYISPTPITYDDISFNFNDATNLDGYLELGTIWFGEYYEPRVGYNPDVQVKNPDPSIKLPSTGGQISILEREKYHTWLFPFDCIYDKARYDTFIDRIGTSKEFVILKKPKGYIGNDYPNPEKNSFYVSMPSHDEIPKAGDKYTAILKLQEER